MAQVTIQLKRGKQETWNELNPVLAYGEPGYEKETGHFKIGDGLTPWKELPYQGSNDSNFISYIQDQELTPTQQFIAQKNLGIAPPERTYYASFADAVADLNAGDTAHAIAAAETATCYVYRDQEDNAHLILTSDIEIASNITFESNIILEVNGHLISFAGDYSLKFSGDRCVLDCRVEGSRIEKVIDSITTKVYTLDFAGAYGELLGGEVFYHVASVLSTALPHVVANNRNNTLMIDGSNISAQYGEATNDMYTLVVAGTCAVKNAKISSLAYGTSVREGKRPNVYNVYVANVATGCTIENCQLSAVSTDTMVNAVGASGVYNGTPIALNIKDSTISADNLSTAAYGVVVPNGMNANIVNTTIFSDGTTGSATIGNGTACGVINQGNLTLKDCQVYGTHNGVQCANESTTHINGGTYKGTGHGGLYFAHVNGKAYVENANIQLVPYCGVHREIYDYVNVYMFAAVYIGGSTNANNIKAYMDNCIIDGNGPELVPDNGGFIGAEPIRFRGSLGEQNNSIYISNCTLMGDGKIRFGDSSHRLYLGFGNRVLCEASMPNCVDSTTYARTVFYNWEEE